MAGGGGDRVRRWAWLWVLLAGLAMVVAVWGAVVDTSDPALVPALILLGAAVVPVAFVVLVAGRRPEHGVGGGTVALTALVGGVVGVVAADTVEYGVLRVLGVVPFLAVGVVEEAAKLVVPVVLVIALRGRRPTDGVVLGVAAGGGFAVLETMGYAFVALVGSGGGLAALDDVLLVRGLLSPAAHMAWTGLTVAALWQAAEGRWRPRASGTAVAAFVVAVALHTAWDASSGILARAVVAAISLGLLAWAVHRTGSRTTPVGDTATSGPLRWP